MSQLNVDTIKKADGTGNLTIPNATGTVVTTAGATFTGDIVLGTNSLFIGGTGSANELSDYEEGTFTATISDAISGGNTSSTSVTGTYTKIGRTVIARFNLESIDTSGMTGTNAVHYHLPFTSSSSMTLTPGIVQTANVNIDTGFQFCAILDSNANRGRIDEMRDATSATGLLVNDLTSGSANLRIIHTYFVD